MLPRIKGSVGFRGAREYSGVRVPGLLVLAFIMVSGLLFAGAQKESTKPEPVQKVEFMTVVDSTSPAGLAWQQVAEDYMKTHANVQITRNYIAYKDFFTQLSVRAMAGKAPALAQSGYTTGEFVEAGVLVETGPYLEKSGWKKEDFWPALWDMTMYKGKQWGVPYTLDTRVWFYNKDVYNKAGVTPPVERDDLLEIGPKILQATGVYAYGMIGTSAAEWCWTFSPFLYSAGGNWIVQDSTGLWKSNVESPEVLELLDFARKLVVNKIVPPSMPNNDTNTNRQLFINQKVASLLSGPWEYGILDKAKQDGQLRFEVGQVLIPKKSVNASTSGGWNWYMFKKDDVKPEVTWDIINFFLKPENIAKGWCDSLPPTRAGIRVGTWSKDPRYDLMGKALANSPFPVPTINGFYELMDLLWTPSMKSITGEVAPEQAMNKLSPDIQAFLDKGQNAVIQGKK